MPENEFPIDYDFVENASREQAIRNIEKYGHSDRSTLLLVWMEQLGKLSRTRTHRPNSDNIGISDEYIQLYQVMSMCYAYFMELEKERLQIDHSAIDLYIENL